jgi:hypothetical protein
LRPLPGPDSAPNPDFARALEHRGKHDVHDADTADEQRDSSDANHDNLEDSLRLLALREQSGRHDNREIAGVVVCGGEDGAHNLGGFNGIRFVEHPQEDAVDLVL